MSDNEILINPADFRSIRVSVDLENTTTRTRVAVPKPPKGAKGPAAAPKENGVEFLELRKKGFVLQVPPRTCASGHNLTLNLKVTGVETPMAIQMTGRVAGYEPGKDGGSDRIEIELTQFMSTEWERFCSLFSDRQRQILEFFRNVKGY